MVAAVALLAVSTQGQAAAPLYDPVVLNVGVNCQWQQACQRRQMKAMGKARKYIARTHPPVWRIHMCNRNAGRGTANVDWAGFNACIRNASLPRPPQRGR